MGEKKSKKNEGGEKKSGELQKKEGGGAKNDGNLTVVLKSDFHCEGCVSKVVKAIRSFEGVEKVMCDADSKKLTVIGKVDPVMLREKVEQKTHKHVELVSPVPKKDGKGKDSGNGSGGGGAEEKKKQNKENKDPKENKGGGGGGGEDNKKTKVKELPITTAVLKVHLHCQGCIQKIYKIVTKFKGYKEMKIDKQKDLITVTGSMDVKELAETLKKHLKKEVEIVPAKKEGGEKKEKGEKGSDNGGGGGGEKGKGGGKKGGSGEGKAKGEEGGGIGGEEMIIGNVGNGMQMMQQMQQPVQFGYPYPYMYGPVYPADQFQNPYPVSVHAPQLFSDENPNACSVM